jgi:uncharacterized protein (TIGR02147 family)
MQVTEIKGKNYIFDYRDYRRFLVDALGGKNKRTGQRGALSRHLGCQTAYLSQVLSGVANLNLEQAYKVNQFLSHDAQAADYFILLVQKERAGTHELKEYFQGKLNEILARRSEIKSRVTKNRNISEPDQAYYYSQWYIGAIHVALSVPQLQTVSELSRYFHLDEGIVREVLDFFISTGLATFEKQRYSIGPSHIHLAKDSKFIKHLHTNWRLLAVQSLERRRDEDLHYSVAYSVSRQDAAKIRQQILNLIEQNMEIVKPSKEETLFCNTIDFFELKS